MVITEALYEVYKNEPQLHTVTVLIRAKTLLPSQLFCFVLFLEITIEFTPN